ncbi:histidine phosphatase family protein [Noviherbaspirillum aridicola]|uniref:Phosphoglycerate mutase n=1 Tax=Noviherbaspirillum aridicola TaxID=2849687 RepID=A0ABQ4Q4M2_9BURK|nr:histidine phosphatase family protein [Noviherbaspirillum aridicola]GIZ52133.1 phosphoglycerate mutase [Noviherbaspirillum aridicola]
MRLHLVRHAAPEGLEGVCYGGTDLSVPASRQRELLARLLPRLPGGLPVFSSPMKRCADLAAALAAALKSAPPTLDGRLREMAFGTWEMQRWDDIPQAEVDAWNADLLDYRPGGGDSVRDVAARVVSFCEDLRRRRGEAAVICHAGTIRLLTRWKPGRSVADIALEAARTPHRIAYGEVQMLDLDKA